MSTASGVKAFRVLPRTLVILFLIILAFGAVPIYTIFELATTGSLELFEPLGRRRIPPWVVFVISWLGWLWFLQLYTGMLRYYRDPEMFVLGPEWIEVGGTRIPFADIKSIKGRIFLGDTIIDAQAGKFTIHVQLAARAVTALFDALPDRYEPKGFRDGPAWFVGK